MRRLLQHTNSFVMQFFEELRQSFQKAVWGGEIRVGAIEETGCVKNEAACWTDPAGDGISPGRNRLAFLEESQKPNYEMGSFVLDSFIVNLSMGIFGP